MTLNTRALETQQEELRRQVEETSQLSKNSERHARATEHLARITKIALDRETMSEAKDAEPEFVDAGGSSGGAEFSTRIKNRGGEARNVRVEYEGPHQLRFRTVRIFDSDTQRNLILNLKHGVPFEFPVKFTIKCTDRLGCRHAMEFELLDSHELRKISHDRNSKTEE